MKKLLAVFVLFFSSFIFAQTFNFNGVSAEAHVFAGMNIPTQSVEKDQFRLDYVRLHVDLSNDEMKIQFRHDFASNKLQLANVSKTFGYFTFTAGRFLDPVWYLYPEPHIMSQTAYPVSVNTFTVLDNGIGAVYTGGSVSIYASVFDCDGNRNFSASIVHKNGGGFIQKNGSRYGFGWILRESYFGDLITIEGGVVRSPLQNAPDFEEYLQGSVKINNKLSLWLQGDFQAVPDNEVSRTLIGAAYQYSKNSHCKFFYNFTEKIAVAKITFFL